MSLIRTEVGSTRHYPGDVCGNTWNEVVFTKCRLPFVLELLEGTWKEFSSCDKELYFVSCGTHFVKVAAVYQRPDLLFP